MYFKNFKCMIHTELKLRTYEYVIIYKVNLCNKKIVNTLKII